MERGEFMNQPIEFWFDFSSPYGYFGSRRIEQVAAAHDRAVLWRPFLLGVLFQTTGQTPLLSQPVRGPYFAHDMARTARFHGIPFGLPEPFPFASIAAARFFYWLEERDRAAATGFAKAVYARAFVDGRAVSSPEEAADVASELGHDRGKTLATLQEPGVKQRLKAINDEALAKGVFGSPYFIADGEPFWGHDRLDQVDRWLATGGW